MNAGIFAGSLQYTVYRGTNLLRQEILAKTSEPSVAYKYVGGLKGFSISDTTRVVWRDTARAWQQYAFGGAVNQDAVGLRARNRLGILEANGGSLAFLPPSHKFFFSREIETNLGYVYYRKDGENSFAIGVRQPDKEVGYKPYGISDEVWNRRVGESRGELNNFALYNAPPGTMQRMPVYFYLSPNGSRATQENVMAFTHDDVYKPLPGYKVMVSHFHFHLNEQLTDERSMDVEPTWLPVFRALGVNLAILADFHSDSHATDTGKVRLDEQSVYFAGCERFSDRDLLLIPGEEPDANFGGHYMFLFPEARFLHARGAAGERAGAALSGGVTAVRLRVSHQYCRERTRSVESGTRPGVADPSADQGFHRLPRRSPGEGLFQERSLPGRFLPIAAGGSIGEAPCEARCMGLLDD